MAWKRFQNGLSATIAHCAPRGEKNLKFPLAGKSPPLAVLLCSPPGRISLRVQALTLELLVIGVWRPSLERSRLTIPSRLGFGRLRA